MQTEPITSIAALRKDLDLTLEDFGAKIGLKSKGYTHKIERENRCPPDIALAIEALSDRRLDAGTLNPAIAAARRSAAA